MPAAPPVITGSWSGVLAPPQIAQMINLLVGGSPFADSLTRFPTSNTAVAFPTASPDRPAWTSEGAALPQIGLHDTAVIVAVKKLGEILQISNEAISDDQVNLTSLVGNLLKDAAGPELDRGLLYGAPGTTPAEPVGVVPNIGAADGTVLDAAITTGIGQIGDAGGAATTIAAKPSLLAKWRNLRDTQNRMLYPDGIGAAFGLAEVGCTQLTDTIIYDRTRLFLIIRLADFLVEMSPDYYFNLDSMAMRVKGRFAVGMPAPAKTARKITVAGAAPTLAEAKK
jgi:HK97 family phage major capsid protein